ncbi:MAG: hypothetical protein AAF399_02485 [Bacteroidota bacterium]
MIKVKKGASPAVLTGTNCRAKVRENIQNQDFKGSYYNKPTVREALEVAHHGKCCYCEVKIRPVATPQVEHYRPKNTLKDDTSHAGYYWLGHEWENLLLACPTCNIAKNSWFPIAGNRVRSPRLQSDGDQVPLSLPHDQSPLLDEQALIINPEYDPNPSDHFTFEPEGTIQGETDQGKETIKRCKLDRDALTIARKQVVDDALRNLNVFFVGYIEGKIEKEGLKFLLSQWFEKLTEALQANFPYAAFRRFGFQQFERFYLGQVLPIQRPLLKAAYDHFISHPS